MGISSSAQDSLAHQKRISMLTNKVFNNGLELIIKSYGKTGKVSVRHCFEEIQFSWLAQALFKNSNLELEQVQCMSTDQIDRSFAALSMDLSLSQKQSQISPELIYLRKQLGLYKQFNDYFMFDEIEFEHKLVEFSQLIFSIARLVNLQEDELPEDLFNIILAIQLKLQDKFFAPVSNSSSLQQSLTSVRRPIIKPLRYITGLERQILTKSATNELNDVLVLQKMDMVTLQEQVIQLQQQNEKLLQSITLYDEILSHELQVDINSDNLETEIEQFKISIDGSRRSSTLFDTINSLITEINVCHQQLTDTSAKSQHYLLELNRLNKEIIDKDSQQTSKQQKLINLQRANGLQEMQLQKCNSVITIYKQFESQVRVQITQQLFVIKQFVSEQKDLAKLIFTQQYTILQTSISQFSHFVSSLHEQNQNLKLQQQRLLADNIQLKPKSISNNDIMIKDNNNSRQLLLSFFDNEDNPLDQSLLYLVQQLVEKYSKLMCKSKEYENIINLAQVDKNLNIQMINQLNIKYQETFSQLQDVQLRLTNLQKHTFDFEQLQEKYDLLLQKYQVDQQLILQMQKDFDCSHTELQQQYVSMCQRLHKSCNNIEILPIDEMVVEIVYQALQNSSLIDQTNAIIGQLSQILGFDCSLDLIENLNRLQISIAQLKLNCTQQQSNNEKMKIQINTIMSLCQQVASIKNLVNENSCMFSTKINLIEGIKNQVDQCIIQIKDHQNYCLQLKQQTFWFIQLIQNYVILNKSQIQQLKESLCQQKEFFSNILPSFYSSLSIIQSSVDKVVSNSFDNCKINSILLDVTQVKQLVTAAQQKLLLIEPSVNNKKLYHITGTQNISDVTKVSNIIEELRNIKVSVQKLKNYLQLPILIDIKQTQQPNQNNDIQTINILLKTNNINTISEISASLKELLAYFQRVSLCDSNNLYDVFDYLSQVCSNWTEEADKQTQLVHDLQNQIQVLKTSNTSKNELQSFLQKHKLTDLQQVDIIFSANTHFSQQSYQQLQYRNEELKRQLVITVNEMTWIREQFVQIKTELLQYQNSIDYEKLIQSIILLLNNHNQEIDLKSDLSFKQIVALMDTGTFPKPTKTQLDIQFPIFKQSLPKVKKYPEPQTIDDYHLFYNQTNNYFFKIFEEQFNPQQSFALLSSNLVQSIQYLKQYIGLLMNKFDEIYEILATEFGADGEDCGITDFAIELFLQLRESLGLGRKDEQPLF